MFRTVSKFARLKPEYKILRCTHKTGDQLYIFTTGNIITECVNIPSWPSDFTGADLYFMNTDT